MDSYDKTMAIIALVTSVGALILLIAIIIGVIFLIKHLIKFTTRTIYEEKARAEERHRQDYDPERDR